VVAVGVVVAGGVVVGVGVGVVVAGGVVVVVVVGGAVAMKAMIDAALECSTKSDGK